MNSTIDDRAFVGQHVAGRQRYATEVAGRHGARTSAWSGYQVASEEVWARRVSRRRNTQNERDLEHATPEATGRDRGVVSNRFSAGPFGVRLTGLVALALENMGR